MNVYCLHSREHQRVKLGLANDLPQRIKQLEGVHGPLILAHYWSFDSRPEASRFELAVHWRFERDHITPAGWLERGEQQHVRAVEWFTESVLGAVGCLDVRAVLKAYAASRVYEVRLAKSDVQELKSRNLSVADAVALALWGRK